MDPNTQRLLPGAANSEQCWFATLGGAYDDQGLAIAVDPDENVYVVGTNQTVLNGSYRLLVAKYNRFGVIQWQRTLSSGYYDRGCDIALDSSNSVYVVGYTNDQGGSYLLLAKYSPSGVLQWQRKLTGYNGEYGNAIAVDYAGRIFVGGQCYAWDGLLACYNSSGSIQWQRYLGENQPVEVHGVAAGPSDSVYAVMYSYLQASGYMILAKLTASGDVVWQRKLSGVYEDGGVRLAVDSSGNVSVVGFTRSQGQGGEDLLIARYDSNGNLLWQRSLGGATEESGAGVALDASGNIYVTGLTSPVTFGNVLMASYTAAGALRWQRTFSGSGGDSGSGIAVGSSGSLYITGYTQTQGGGGSNLLIVKLPSDGSKLGSYGNFTYSSSSFTDASLTLTSSNGELFVDVEQLTAGTPSLTDAAANLTSATTYI